MKLLRGKKRTNTEKGIEEARVFFSGSEGSFHLEEEWFGLDDLLMLILEKSHSALHG